ncbi:amidohydrolase [Natronospirillum operosum]|uniref:Amidohydrolase n=1 Tax=Natronospirillum operosum TaxID=2759953 RepID=A0A4Z0W6J1_9GAMM|nr:amidohydrolase family protein [Natronospirillum operosum]TGG93414.1 amidohydrolase [Natronospirillum operosum]
MRIDAHHHFWQYNAAEYGWISDQMALLRRDYMPDDLLVELSQCNIDGTVVVQARQTEAETRWLLSLARENPFIKGVVGWVDLRAPDLEARLNEYKKEVWLKGFRHVLEDEPDPGFMLNSDFLGGVEALADHDFSYDLLIRPDQLPQAGELVRKLPPMRLVVDHMAKPDIRNQGWQAWADGMACLASFDHVYCKMSGLVTEADWQGWQPSDFEPYLDHVFQVFGPERVMFGSDWPVCKVAGRYRAVHALASDYVHRRYPEYEAAVLGENAMAFYRL